MPVHTKAERKAEAFVLTCAMFEGGFPILINHAVRVFPAMYFAGVSASLGSILHGILLFQRKAFPKRISFRMWLNILGVTACNSVLALFFIFLGTQSTSGINTALLMQSEMLWSFLIFTILFGERYSSKQVIGAIGVLAGTLLVLYNGSFIVNRGDLFIILGTLFYPFGNNFAKKALQELPSSFVLMIRHGIGAIAFLTLSFMFESIGFVELQLLKEHFWLVVLYGVVVLVGSKLCWYEGLRVLPLSKAISIVLSYPVFSLLFAALFFGELPTLYQTVGFLITLCGLSFLLYKKPTVSSIPPDLV